MTINNTNHLASNIDKLEKKGQSLPLNLSQQFMMMQKYSKELKFVLQQNLPMADLERCFVVAISDGTLTVSVDSMTLANHLRYMANQHLTALKMHSPLFKDIFILKVITTHHRDPSQPVYSARRF